MRHLISFDTVLPECHIVDNLRHSLLHNVRGTMSCSFCMKDSTTPLLVLGTAGVTALAWYAFGCPGIDSKGASRGQGKSVVSPVAYGVRLCTTPQSSTGTLKRRKRLHFVRHAEGFHNLYGEVVSLCAASSSAAGTLEVASCHLPVSACGPILRRQAW